MDKLKSFIKQYFVLVILIVLIILFGCLRPESFLTMSNMFTVIRQSSIMGIATIGLLFVMVAGGIDLSLGSVISVESVLVAVLLTKFGWGLLPAYLCGLAGGTLVGLVTGAIIVKTGIFPMIGTLALQIILQGIAYLVCGGMPVSNLPLNAKMIGQGYIGPIPIPVIVFIIVIIIAALVLNRTYIGRHFYAIGSNEEATRLSGIDVDKFKMIAYVIGGLFAGIAAIFWTATNPSIPLSEGSGKELDAIAGVYIGGTSTTGGFASIVGTIFGAIILVVIRQGLNFMLVQFNSTLSPTFITYAVTGVIVVGAVLLDVLKRQSANRVRQEKKAEKFARKTKERIAELNLEKDYALSAKGNAEADKRVKEIDEEIASLKAELKNKLPALKAEDMAEAEEEKKRKNEIKAAEKSEKNALKK